MSLNTYPYNPFPASTDKLDETHNAELQLEVDQLKEDVEKLETDKTDTAVMAPAFDTETGVYAVGDLVMYQGKLYEFTSAHETAGDWDPTEVTEKTVADEIGDVKSGLTNYELQNNINLEVPNRKNLAGNPYGVMLNSSGVFVSANVRSYIIPTNLGTITISVDDITKISDDVIRIGYCDDIPAESGTGVRVSSMTTNTYTITPNTGYKYIVVSNLLDNDYGWQDIQIELGSTATAYAPYIPSVESRIEAVESVVTSYTLTPATDVTINRSSCVKVMNTVIVDAIITFGADKSASSALLYGIPAIGNTNIPIYAVDDNATARPVRLYNNGVFTSGAFTASEKIHIMGSYTLTN